MWIINLSCLFGKLDHEIFPPSGVLMMLVNLSDKVLQGNQFTCYQLLRPSKNLFLNKGYLSGIKNLLRL